MAKMRRLSGGVVAGPSRSSRADNNRQRRGGTAWLPETRRNVSADNDSGPGARAANHASAGDLPGGGPDRPEQANAAPSLRPTPTAGTERAHTPPRKARLVRP